MLRPGDVASFRESGFVVLPRAFDPGPLTREMDRSFADGLVAGRGENAGSGGVTFRCVPMTCALTPESVALIETLAGAAADLLGRAVLPVRAKGTLYRGNSGWHRDSDLGIPSIGFVAYLESLTAERGALRVQPGSHREPPGDAALRRPFAEGLAIETEPGDVIAFDEHLVHGSTGGGARRQWRIDFIGDPLDRTEEASVRSYFARIFDTGWDGGYDVERFPSYGPSWRSADQPWTERLRELGAYDVADAQEDAVRAKQRRG